MRTIIYLIMICGFLGCSANAAPLRTVTADQIASPDLTKLFLFPSASTTLVGLNSTQTLTNKTLTTPVIAQITSGSGSLTLNTSGAVAIPNGTYSVIGTASTDTLTNKTFGDELRLTQISTPTAPSSGFTKVYPKSNGLLYKLNSTGSEAILDSVTSASTSGERHERARLNFGGTPSVVSQSGSWISLNTDNGTGDVSWTIAAGIFSGDPSCVCTAGIGTGDANSYECMVNVSVGPSSTFVRLRTRQRNAAGAHADFDATVFLMCHGPR